jgi:hypothetical protein
MQNLIQEFYRIREIPYRIPLSLEEEDQCCSWKAKQLFVVCDHLGIPCRYRVCEFLWSDLPLPKEVASIAHDNLCTHVFLEIQIGDERIYVDPTRDSWLKNVFHIHERDWISSTYFAVKPIRFYDLPTSHEIMTWANIDQETVDDLVKHAPFYKALNNWFVSIRK